MAHYPRVKAAVIAALLTGESPRRVSEQFGVPRTTVLRWRGEIPAVVGINKTDLKKQLTSGGFWLRLRKLRDGASS